MLADGVQAGPGIHDYDDGTDVDLRLPPRAPIRRDRRPVSLT